MPPSGVAPPRPRVGVAELPGATGPEAACDVTANAAGRARTPAAPRTTEVPPAVGVPPVFGVRQSAAPASPRRREALVASAGAVRLEPMGGGVARGQPVTGGRMSAGG